MLIGGLLAALGAEGVLRALLFWDHPLARSAGARLRRPEYFADGTSDEDYWKLQWIFLDPERRLGIPGPDARLGWTGGVRPGTYEHPEADLVGARRPVLLYGDSFAQCNTPPELCFQALLERSDLGATHRLVNYGVGGYGLDQIHLLLRETIDHWSGRDPLVVVGILLDDDLNRSLFDFRSWPKPRLVERKGRLAASGPVITDEARFLERHPPKIRSYLWSYLANRHGALPGSVQARMRGDRLEEMRALNRRILEEIRADLESRGVEHFLLLFCGEPGLRRAEGMRWAEELVLETAAATGMPAVHTRPWLLAAAGAQASGARALFGGAPRLEGHYNELGNLAAFEALRAGIEGRSGGPDVPRLESLVRAAAARGAARVDALELRGRKAHALLRGARSAARVGSAPYPPLDTIEAPYLVLRRDADGHVEFEVELQPPASRWRARATSVDGREASLRIQADGRPVATVDLPAHPGSVPIDLDLAGACRLRIVAEGPGELWVHLDGVTLE